MSWGAVIRSSGHVALRTFNWEERPSTADTTRHSTLGYEVIGPFDGAVPSVDAYRQTISATGIIANISVPAATSSELTDRRRERIQQWYLNKSAEVEDRWTITDASRQAVQATRNWLYQQAFIAAQLDTDTAVDALYALPSAIVRVWYSVMVNNAGIRMSWASALVDVGDRAYTDIFSSGGQTRTPDGAFLIAPDNIRFVAGFDPDVPSLGL